MIDGYKIKKDRTADAVLLSGVTDEGAKGVLNAETAIWIGERLNQEATGALVNIQDYRFLVALRNLYKKTSELSGLKTTLVRFAQDAIGHEFREWHDIDKPFNLGSAAHQYGGYDYIEFSKAKEDSEAVFEGVSGDEKSYVLQLSGKSNLIGFVHADDLEFLERTRSHLKEIMQRHKEKSDKPDIYDGQSISQIFGRALLNHYQALTGETKIESGICAYLMNDGTKLEKGKFVELPPLEEVYGPS
jgi:hypothetical protein